MLAYSAAAVANAFLALARRDGVQLTNMQLQKLVYIAHGWCLALLGRALLYDDIHAWQWGPVIKPLYESLKLYGGGFVSGPIPQTGQAVDPNSQEMKIIEGVWKAYGHLDGMKLSAITHAAGTPWNDTWRKWKYAKISDALIRQHYLQLKNERAASRPKAGN